VRVDSGSSSGFLIGGVGYASSSGCTNHAPSRLGSGPTKIFSVAVATSEPTKIAGELMGGLVAGPSGAAIGGLIGNMIGVGVNVSYVPSTQSWYAGPTAVFSPLGGGSGVSANYVNVPNTQDPNSIANGFSYSLTFQPTQFAGSTVVKSPGNGPAVVGPSIGSRTPVSTGASYNICFISCGGC
jgi:hypothetical protein